LPLSLPSRIAPNRDFFRLPESSIHLNAGLNPNYPLRFSFSCVFMT
jgi:hypothetical protein